MTGECDSYGREVTKYVLLDVTEVEDVGNCCPEIRSYYTAILCHYCKGLFTECKIKKRIAAN
ncbi:MAG: hypothetical protein WBF33_24495 [Candidatus Nitrosopolaris sp.]|jgi:hypothetical protein